MAHIRFTRSHPFNPFVVHTRCFNVHKINPFFIAIGIFRVPFTVIVRGCPKKHMHQMRSGDRNTFP